MRVREFLPQMSMKRKIGYCDVSEEEDEDLPAVARMRVDEAA